MPKYGDKTAKELDNYLKNYKPVLGKTRTGLAAPVKDMFRNYNTMKEMKLKESDPFFHCKANYEATKRSGVYGAGVANIIDAGKEMKKTVEDLIELLNAYKEGLIPEKF